MAKRKAGSKAGKTGAKRETGKVGRGHPPIEHRFAAGNQAAVGHGRPRKLAELKELILETLAEEVSATLPDGRSIRMTRAQQMIKTMLIKSPSDRLALLEYAFGKVPQQIDINKLSDDDLLGIILTQSDAG